MPNLTNNQMDQIESITEGSKVWQETNAKIKAMYIKAGRKPTDQEYQALRTMIFCKTVLEDKEVMKTLSNSIWEQLQTV